MLRRLADVRVLSTFVTLVSIAQWSAVVHGDSVSGFSGSFSQAIPIDVPPFRGLEPRLALGYSSQGGSGFAGVGWGLGGFGVVQRFSPGFGAPKYDTTDIFALNGQELIACPAGNSPSCTTGGTHTTKNESYLKIIKNSGANTWTVWAKNGAKTVFSALYPQGQVFDATLFWGQTSVVDTHNSSVTYTWGYDGNLDCYPDSVTFGPYSVKLFRELRNDVTTAGIGAAGLRQSRYRLRSVLVKYGSARIRAYRLDYAYSGVTSRSLLTSVQQFGKDVVINETDGAITVGSGTSLPPRTFQYQDDPGSGSFQIHPAQ